MTERCADLAKAMDDILIDTIFGTGREVDPSDAKLLDEIMVCSR